MERPIVSAPVTEDTAVSAMQCAILVVDDNETNRAMLSRRLAAQGYAVTTAEDGPSALRLLQTQPFDLVLLDIMMPGMDGYEVLQRLKQDQLLRHLPVIVITAVDDVDSTVRCIEMGAEDHLHKPFNPTLLRARVGACLEKKRLYDQEQGYRDQLRRHSAELEERVRNQVQEISSSQLATIFAMSRLAESKDPETGSHLERMREYCKTLSQCLSTTDRYGDTVDELFVETIYAASPLHDIGKVGVPDPILLKPGRLTPEEWVLMKTHCTIGADTLRAVHEHHPGNAFIRMGIDIAQNHHEKWDGSGYPYGLAGEDIPLAARILAVGDVYDALTSKRCYKDAFTHEASAEIIVQGRGTHFDPDLVDAFLDNEDEFRRIRSCLQDPEA
jgi:putative two-component system response regulator